MSSGRFRSASAATEAKSSGGAPPGQLLLGGGDGSVGGQPEVGGQPRRGLGLARPRLVEPDPGQPHGRLQPQHVALGDVGGALGQPLLRRFQGALQPVDRLGEKALGVAGQEVTLVDPRHLERHVGPLHARLRFACAQPVRGGLLARGDLAERVQRLDDAEVRHEGGRQVGELEVLVLRLDGLRGRSGHQRGLQRRADARVQRDNRPAGRVHLAALGLQHRLLGARGGDLGILCQGGAHSRPPVQGASPGPRRRQHRQRQEEDLSAGAFPHGCSFSFSCSFSLGGAGRRALVRVAEGVSAEQIGQVQGRLRAGDAPARHQVLLGSAGESETCDSPSSPAVAIEAMVSAGS